MKPSKGKLLRLTIITAPALCSGSPWQCWGGFATFGEVRGAAERGAGTEGSRRTPVSPLCGRIRPRFHFAFWILCISQGPMKGPKLG